MTGQLPPLLPPQSPAPLPFAGAPLFPQQPASTSEPSEVSPLEQRIFESRAQRERADEELFLNNLGAALKKNPKLRAEANKVAAETGVDPNTAERNLDLLREVARRREIERMELRKNNPVLADQLYDLEFAAVAHQQIENLAWWERIGGNWTAGQWEDIVGRLGAKSRDSGLNDQERETLRYAQGQLSDLPVADLENGLMAVLTQSSRMAGQMSRSVPRAIATGLGTSLVAGGTAAAVSGPFAPISAPSAAFAGWWVGFTSQMALDTYLVEGGQSYLSLIERRVPEERARWVSRGVGALNAAIEIGGAKLFEGPMRAALKNIVFEGAVEGLTRPTIAAASKKFAKDYVKMVGGEMTEEISQEFVTALGEAIAERKALDGGELFQRLKDTAVATAQGMAIIGALQGPLPTFLRDAKLAKNAKRTGRFYEAIAGNAQARADFIKQNPQADEAFLARVVKGTPAENTYVDRLIFLDTLKRLGLNPAALEGDIPGIAAQLASDAEDVVIPTEKIGSKLAGSELEQALREHMRLAQEDPSLAEVKEHAQEEHKRNAEALDQEVERAAQWLEEAQTVENDLRQQLLLAGVTQEQAAIEANLYRMFVESRATSEGTTPATIYAQNPYTVTSTQTQNDTRAEQPADSATRQDGLRRNVRFDDALAGEQVPSYGEAKPDAVNVVGIHYSRDERTSLTSEAYGTGLPGAERRRVQWEPELNRRVFFYVDVDNTGINPEPGVGDVAHAVRLTNLYDADKDPSGVLSRAYAAAAAAEAVKDYNREPTDLELMNAAERAIIEAGYDGYLGRGAGNQGVAVVIGSKHTAIPVRKVTPAASVLRQEAQGERPLQFYSALLAAIDSLNAVKPLTPAQWKQQFATWLNKGTVKKAEFELTGLQEFVDTYAQDQTISPSVVRAAFETRFNRELKVVTYGPLPATELARLQNEMGALTDERDRVMRDLRDLNEAENAPKQAAINQKLEERGLPLEEPNEPDGSENADLREERSTLLHVRSYLNNESDNYDVKIEPEWNDDDSWSAVFQSVRGVDGNIAPFKVTFTPEDIVTGIEGNEIVTDTPGQLYFGATPRVRRLTTAQGVQPFTGLEYARDSGYAHVIVETGDGRRARFRMPFFESKLGAWQPFGGAVETVDGVQFSFEELREIQREMFDVLDLDERTEPDEEAVSAFGTAMNHLNDAAAALRRGELDDLSEALNEIDNARSAVSDYSAFDADENLRDVEAAITAEIEARQERQLAYETALEERRDAYEEILEEVDAEFAEAPDAEDRRARRADLANRIKQLDIDIRRLGERIRGGESTHFSSYTLGGGKDYTELTLNLDPSMPVKFDASRVGHGMTTEMDRNRLIHLRVKTRVGEPVTTKETANPEPSKVLFVEEIQSDWGQRLHKNRAEIAAHEAKRPKVVDVQPSDNVRESNRDGLSAFDVYIPGSTPQAAPVRYNTVWARDAQSAREKAQLDIDYHHEKRAPSAMPAHPLIEKTDVWVRLGVQQLLMHAVENGFDKVAFTSGEQQLTIYPSLSSVLSKVEWLIAPWGENQKMVRLITARGGVYEVAVVNGKTGPILGTDGVGVLKGNQQAAQAGLHGVNLSDLIGKGMSDKIAASDQGALAGAEVDAVDISETRRGMDYFYGKIVPKAVAEVLKKLGAPPATTQQILVANKMSPQLTFDITDAMREKVRAAGGFPLFQEGQERRTPRGEFDRRTMQTLLREGADVSTFVHETGHYFLDVLMRSASLPNATESTARDAGIYLRWTGVESLAAWNAMSPEEQAKHHERFAYSFEKYIFTGKAPSRELQSLFDKLAQFLRDVYRGLIENIDAIYRGRFGEDLPELSSDIRGVMDRMLAAESEIDRAAAVRARMPLFQTPDEAGMSANEWADYLALDNARRDEAVNALQRERLRNMKWLATEEKGVLREIQQQHDEERGRVATEVLQEMRAEPIRRAQEWLRSGRQVDERGAVTAAEPDENHKLDRDAVALLLGDDAERLMPRLKGYVRVGGLGPDAVASLFGYENGRTFVNELLDLPPVKLDLKRRVNDRMLAEHPDLVPGTTEHKDAVAGALNGEAALRMTATELKHAGRILGPVRVLLAAAKDAAIRQLADTPVRKLRPDLFDQGALRAAQRAQRALAAGDHAGMVQAKRAELLQRALASEARRAKDEVRRGVESFARFGKADKNLGKTQDTRFVNAGRAILGSFGLGSKKVAPLEWLAQVKDYAPALHDQLAEIVAEVSKRDSFQDYRDLPLSEFRSMRDAVDALWNRSKRERAIRDGAKMVALDDALGELTSRLLDIGIPDVQPGVTSAVTKRDELMREVNSTKAKLRRVEHWADSMDGAGGPGPFTKFIVRPVWNALAGYRKERNTKIKRLLALVESVELTPRTIAAPALNYTFGAGNAGVGRAELLGALLHSGNQSNLNKLLGGREFWTTRDADGKPVVDADGNVDRSKWDKFIERAIRDGDLTKRDFDFAQAVWDLLEELKPKMQEAHFELFGFYFKEVKATPISTPWGVYRGGYVPAKTDQFIVQDARIKAKMNELEGDFRNALPAVPSGSTKSRVEGYRRPLSLDIRRLVGHIDETVRFAFVQPAIKDVLNVLRDDTFANTLAKIDPTAVEAMILPMLNRAATQRATELHSVGWVNKFFNGLRGRSSVALMFGNIVNTAQNVFNLLPAMLKVKPAYLWAGLTEVLKGGAASRISELSPVMSERFTNQMRDLTEHVNDLVLNPSKFQRVQKLAAHNGMFLQRALDNVVGSVVWLGAYNQAVAELQGDAATVKAEAIQRADAAVRLTQSSNNPEDVSAVEAGKPLVKLLLQFYGYFNNLANLNATEFTKVWRDLGWRGNLGRLGMIYLLGFAGPMLLSDLIVRAASGGDDDDDEELTTGAVASWFFGAQLRGAAALVPFGSSLMVPVNAFNNKTWDDRMMTSPSVSALENATVGTARAAMNVAGGQLTGKNVRDVLTLVALATGIPVTVLGKPLGYATDVARGAKSPEGAGDLVRGLLSGR